MISAEKVLVGGKFFIKVSFKRNTAIDAKMKTVKGALYNPASGLWSVPYENRDEFETKLGDFLIIWNNESDITAGGIDENLIPKYPIVDGYLVEYDELGNITNYSGFKNKPWANYQVQGFNVLTQRRFLILADDCGLGKTYQVATAIEARRKRGDLKHGLVLCKASLIYNWRDEIEMHTNSKCIVLTGNQQQRINLIEEARQSNEWTFMITSYETYRESLGALQFLDNHRQLDFCVLDEATKVINPMSKIGQAIHKIPFRYRYILTATPLINTPLEAYNYLKWGGLFRSDFSYFDFQKRYAEWGGVGNKQPIMFKNMKELKGLIQQNMLRRLKEDKLKDLPDVTFKNLRIDMNNNQQKLYKAVKESILEDLQDTSLESIPHALAKLMRLQQIADSPALIGGDLKSAKLDALDELVEELVVEGKQKVIIFSRFKTLIEILKEKYKQFNPAVVTGDVDATGKSESSVIKQLKKEFKNWDSIPLEERRKLITKRMTSERQLEVYKFQNDPTCMMFLGTSGACREGLTLTASSNVIFIDIEWAWAHVEQAFSRAHRIGQKNSVMVYFLLCRNTIDEHVFRTVRRKESMAQFMIDNIEEMQTNILDGNRARHIIAELIGISISET